jgi:hypothetical protein
VAPGNGDLFEVPAVAAYLAATPEDVTAAVYDEVTGVTSVYRPGVAQDTASIMKVDILATLLAQDQSTGRRSPRADQQLATDMIEESDNDDAQDLWDSEGGATAVGAFDTHGRLDPDRSRRGRLLGAVDDDRGRSGPAPPHGGVPQRHPHPRHRPTSSTSWSTSIPTRRGASLPGVVAGSTVALKNGWLPLDSGGWQVNSIGYIDGDGRDYVIAVLTDDDTEADGINFIQGLSGLIWQELAPTAS